MSCPAEVFTSPIQLIWQVAFGLRREPKEKARHYRGTQLVAVTFSLKIL